VKQSISGGWYLAFFVIGILLGLLALQLLDKRDPLALLFPSTPQQDKGEQQPASHTKKTVAPPSQASTFARRSTPASPTNAVATEQLAPPPPPRPAPIHEPLVCDQKVAREVRDKAREIAEITDYGDHLSVRLRDEWRYYADSVRHSFVQKFADSDACLNGRSRTIEFFYQGKHYAISNPDSGISYD